MNESFVATYSCRICKITIKEARKSVSLNEILLQTKSELISLYHQLEYCNNDTFNFYSIKKKNLWVELKFYDFVDSSIVDIFHDFLEGICHRDIKYVLKYLIKIGIVDLSNLNNKISTFDYGLHKRSNHPCPIDLNKNANLVGQRGAHMFYLITYLPLLLTDEITKLIHEGTKKWRVILLLIEIMKIVFAPTISYDMLDRLTVLIKDHHSLIINEFNSSMIMKDHLITHLPMIINKMGPPRIHWTMKYESKNGFLKSFVYKLKNFKDIAHTLANRHQKCMLQSWNNRKLYSEDEPQINNRK
ncbi:uncharacterized protein LOC122855048 [Aphidius gifuensis]|uniref:uncharacterized protein LOC122855048 n=1 Tax=Aphidius gifuensis TaxID=684658 RepID=UPI001CDCA06E|nr:uncharacterized protein LOC122855048 [Aphidius gifuensis]